MHSGPSQYLAEETQRQVFLTDGLQFSHHIPEGLNHSDMLKGGKKYLGNNQFSLLHATSKRLLL